MPYKSLAESILLAPAENGANKLCILTKSASPNMASWLLFNHIRKLKTFINIELIIDTAGSDGISVSAHEGFKGLHTMIPNFICSYIYESIPVYTNLYIWLKDDIPIVAYAGTAAFEQSDFLVKTHESISLYNTSEAWEQYQTAVNNSVYCNYAEVEEDVMIYQTPAISASIKKDCDPLHHRSDEVFLPLVTKRTGEPGIHSGLNWGQRKGRNPNQAYIPLPIKIAKSGFFPVDPIESPPHFSVVTDDKRHLILRVEQQNQKAITTPLSNAQLGEYFRNRLNLANGVFVTRADLERHGRINVRFVKIDSEHYYMDFSV